MSSFQSKGHQGQYYFPLGFGIWKYCEEKKKSNLNFNCDDVKQLNQLNVNHLHHIKLKNLKRQGY